MGAYRRLSGRVPYRHVDPPTGVRLLPLAEVPDPETRLQALRTYEDRVGHHAVTSEAAADGAGGFDSHLSVVAVDQLGRGVGVCRAAIEDGEARLDAPASPPSGGTPPCGPPCSTRSTPGCARRASRG